MTKTTMRSMLRMAIFGGAVALSPAAALADSWTGPSGVAASETVPDHQTAQAGGAGDAERAKGLDTVEGVPDHQTAQERGAGAAERPKGLDTVEGVPDHQAAQERGASSR